MIRITIAGELGHHLCGRSKSILKENLGYFMEPAKLFASKVDSDGFPQEKACINGQSDLVSTSAQHIYSLERGGRVEEGSLQRLAELAREVSDVYCSVVLQIPRSSD